MSTVTNASCRRSNATQPVQAFTAAHHVGTRTALVSLFRLSSHMFSLWTNGGIFLANVDPNAVPGHLRNSVLPALRRVYLDEVQDASPPPPIETEAEVSKLRAENAILRASSESWKRRANLHSAVIYGVAKVAREQILNMRAEREQLEQKYRNLKHEHTDLK